MIRSATGDTVKMSYILYCPQYHDDIITVCSTCDKPYKLSYNTIQVVISLTNSRVMRVGDAIAYKKKKIYKRVELLMY